MNYFIVWGSIISLIVIFILLFVRNIKKGPSCGCSGGSCGGCSKIVTKQEKK